MNQTIPKIIHYCWFGNNPKPELVERCISSWKRYCPDYEIVEWNEASFDVHSNLFTEEAYQARKWAFVSDYVRGYALLRYGGIYLDTDMELLKPLDSLLNCTFFAGFEARDSVAAGIIGSIRDNDVIINYLEYYQEKHFSQNGNRSVTTSPIILTQILKAKGLKLNGKKQFLSGVRVYSKNVFYPTNLLWAFGKYGSKTIGVHHYMDSWGKNSKMNERPFFSRLKLCMIHTIRNIFGTDTTYRLGKILRKRK